MDVLSNSSISLPHKDHATYTRSSSSEVFAFGFSLYDASLSYIVKMKEKIDLNLTSIPNSFLVLDILKHTLYGMKQTNFIWSTKWWYFDSQEHGIHIMQ